jgi:hypothetical protein
MGSKLRRRELIPEDETITALLSEPKLVHGQFGRQLQVDVQVVDGEYRGTTFRTWFGFSKDKESGEEFISYGGPLYQIFAMVEPEIDEILDDENLTEKKYEQFCKKTANKLDEVKIMARVGVKAPKNNPEKKSNVLQPGTVGLYRDPDKDFDDLQYDKE